MEIAALDAQRLATAAELRRAMLRILGLKGGKKIAACGHLGEQRGKARPDAQEAAASILPHQFPTIEADDALGDVNLLPAQAGDVGLAAARLPKHLVVKLALLVTFLGQDALMLLRGDGGELLFPQRRPSGLCHHRRN